MEFDNNNPSYYHPSYLDWDPYNFGMLNTADMSSMVMETSEPFFFTPPDSDLSTGYLQDALVEWTNHCKRRRLFSDHETTHTRAHEHVLKNCCKWNTSRSDHSQNSNHLDHFYNNTHSFGDEALNSSLSSIYDGEMVLPEIKVPEDTRSASEILNSSSSSSHKDKLFEPKYTDENENPITRDPLSSSEDSCVGLRKKLMKNRVVYPFEVVKPGGYEGDMTLNDINERMLMRPTRPVRHPVGDFACRPCVSPNGATGISGKAVVAFTRIQTQGRGTITIIRTSG